VLGDGSLIVRGGFCLGPFIAGNSNDKVLQESFPQAESIWYRDIMYNIPLGSEVHPSEKEINWVFSLPAVQAQQLFLFKTLTEYFIHSNQAFVSPYPLSISKVF
jgi:hypothetical protein